MNLYTIGFTKSTAEDFFARLRGARVRKIVDVRLKPDSQLSGFAKRRDLKYFLALHDIEYEHLPVFAPTTDLLKAYRNKEMSWDQYAGEYIGLIRGRGLASALTADAFSGSCLLCSEHRPHFCHRRLAAEVLRKSFDDKISIKHL